jgi:hypothetical protein
MFDKKNKNKQEENYLNNFLNNENPTSDNSNNEKLIKEFNTLNNNVEGIKDEILNNKNEFKLSSLNYLNIDVNILPLGKFYKTGTQIKIRPATVAEVQAYSIVDNKNYIDMTEKMNQILSACVKYILPNGSFGSYKDIKDGDRLFLIFMIREITFQQGNSLAKDVQCKNCDHEFKIHLRSTSNEKYPKTFDFYEINEQLEKYFNPELRVFEFNIDNEIFRIAPPTIGIQEIFFEDMKAKIQNDKKPNLSFLKIMTCLLWDRNSITEEGLKKKEIEFKSLSMKTFQVLNKAVDLMTLGIKGLKQNCPLCGTEVHTDINFQGGASSIFAISDPFDELNNE